MPVSRNISSYNVTLVINILLTIIFLPLLIQESFAQKVIQYNIAKPNKKVILPEILNEVSGLTDVSASRIACIQDEVGIIFIYDFNKDQIVARRSFNEVGDFEGLTYTGKSIFILRSDGRLTEWENFNDITAEPKLRHQMLSLLTNNNEGLCYDPKFNRLLISAKSKPAEKEGKEDRYIYAYDLLKNELINEPVYNLNTNIITEKASALKIQSKKNTPKGKPRPLNFRPSSLAIHPVSDKIYIISAVDKLLLIMNRKGDIENVVELNPVLFAKAEGITFLPDATMIITNEAAGKVPTLLVFECEQ